MVAVEALPNQLARPLYRDELGTGGGGRHEQIRDVEGVRVCQPVGRFGFASLRAAPASLRSVLPL